MAKSKLLPGEESLAKVRESFWVMLPKWTLTATLYWWWWRHKEFEVTNRRVIYRKGLYSTTERTVGLENVLDVEVRRGLWGRIWGYGSITVETAGSHGAEFRFAGAPHPDRIRDTILEAQEARKAELAAKERAEMARAIAEAQAAQSHEG